MLKDNREGRPNNVYARNSKVGAEGARLIGGQGDMETEAQDTIARTGASWMRK